jgi:hypothetical protein
MNVTENQNLTHASFMKMKRINVVQCDTYQYRYIYSCQIRLSFIAFINNHTKVIHYHKDFITFRCTKRRKDTVRYEGQREMSHKFYVLTFILFMRVTTSTKP